jgi:Enoyl-CoA hydratase/isomerase
MELEALFKPKSIAVVGASEKPTIGLMLLRTMKKPVIASIQGHLLGSGCELVVLCDLTTAADNATFGEPEVRFSAVGPAIVMPMARWSRSATRECGSLPRAALSRSRGYAWTMARRSQQSKPASRREQFSEHRRRRPRPSVPTQTDDSPIRSWPGFDPVIHGPAALPVSVGARNKSGHERTTGN